MLTFYINYFFKRTLLFTHFYIKKLNIRCYTTLNNFNIYIKDSSKNSTIFHKYLVFLIYTPPSKMFFGKFLILSFFLSTYFVVYGTANYSTIFTTYGFKVVPSPPSSNSVPGFSETTGRRPQKLLTPLLLKQPTMFTMNSLAEVCSKREGDKDQ